VPHMVPQCYTAACSSNRRSYTLAARLERMSNHQSLSVHNLELSQLPCYLDIHPAAERSQVYTQVNLDTNNNNYNNNKIRACDRARFARGR